MFLHYGIDNLTVNKSCVIPSHVNPNHGIPSTAPTLFVQPHLIKITTLVPNSAQKIKLKFQHHKRTTNRLLLSPTAATLSHHPNHIPRRTSPR